MGAAVQFISMAIWLCVALMLVAFAQAAPQHLVRNYTVREGETLTSISEKTGLSLEQLQRSNNIGSTEQHTIIPGQILQAHCQDGCCKCKPCIDMKGYDVAECEAYCCPYGSMCKDLSD